MKNLSIIIPVYNEEKAIGKTVTFLETFLKKYTETEAILINDGSTDQTQETLNKVKNKKIRIINLPKNKGYGASIKKGLETASYQYIALTDADASYPNHKIAELFKEMQEENADMVIGARIGKNTEIQILRKFAKGFLRKLAEYLSEEKIPDLNSGLRIVKKDLILKFLKFLPNGFSLTSTLTICFLANDYVITYKPIDYYKREGKSKIKPIKDTLGFLQLIIRTAMFFNPLKVFLPLSAFFIILAFLVLITTYLSGKVMDITVIILFVTGLNFLAIGLLADLIDKRLSK
jgi:glycosyltransferase involved in cell wall biosynthesis